MENRFYLIKIERESGLVQYIYDRQEKTGIAVETAKDSYNLETRLCLQGEIERLEKELKNPGPSVEIKELGEGPAGLILMAIIDLKVIEKQRNEIAEMESQIEERKKAIVPRQKLILQNVVDALKGVEHRKRYLNRIYYI